MLPILQRVSRALNGLRPLAPDLGGTAVLEFMSPSAALLGTPVPHSARRVVWMVGALVAALLVVAQTIQVDRVVSAAGRVVSTAPTIVIQSLDTAVVRSILVHEGQRVRAGDTVARLDPTFASADAASLQSQVSALQAEVARLSAEVSGQPYVPAKSDPTTDLQQSIFAKRQSERTLKMEAYRQKIDGLTSSAAHAQAETETLKTRLALAQEIENMRKTLANDQVGSRLNWLVASDNRLEVERSLASAEGSGSTARSDLAAMTAERDAYVANWTSQAAQSLSEQSRKLTEAQEQLKKALLRQSMVDLRADRDATVLTIAKVSEGSVLQPGERFITLVPSDVPLEIEASIPGRDNGFLAQGDPAQIKFATFPYAQYGMGLGSVRSVSADSFTATDQADARSAHDVPATDANQPFYRARVSIDKADLRNVPADFHVMPGMPVTVDITIGRHTILAYLLQRVLTVTSEGMREP